MRRSVRVALGLPVLAAAAWAGTIAWLGRETGQASQCHGNSARGGLAGGRQLPYSGDNFRAYSLLGHLAGRTFMHSSVREVVLEAYADVARQHPELRYLYAEVSWPWGGRLWPHRTHQNGTSVDFHVPVRNGDGHVDLLPTSMLSLFGYGVDFDRQGKSDTRTIDFEAMALHLIALEKAARARGIPIQRVIFDVELQPRLLATRSGAQLRGRLVFNRAQAWVRHDEHYHVDFAVPCR